MPKRSASEKERQPGNKRRRFIIYSSSSDSEENLDNGVQPVEVNDLPQPDPLSQTPVGKGLPTVPEVNDEPAPDLAPEVLQALGEPINDIPVYGPNIHVNLAQRWLPILKKGLQQEAREKLLSQYAVPENCKLLKAPSLNVEISAAVNDLVRNRDKKLQANQDQLGLSITAVSQGLTSLLTVDDKLEAIRKLSDGCRLLSDLHHTQTQIRTKLITPGLEKSFLTDEDRDETLFGSKLSDKIKASKAIEKQGLQIKKAPTPKPPTSAAVMSTPRPRYQGNWMAPPRYPSSSRGGGRGGAPYKPPATRSYRRAPPSTSSANRPSTSASNRRA